MQIPAQNMEIEKIYSQLFSKNYRAVAICSANQGEGVTSIALALAQRNLLAGNTTLVVDFNLYRPSINKLLELDVAKNKNEVLEEPQLVTTDNHHIALIGVTSPERRDVIMKLRKPGVLEQCIEKWQESYNTIIFDTSPINRVNAKNIPPERVAAACDGSVLVVLAGNTTEAMVSSAVDKLNTAGAQLFGTVYNDRDNPPLKDELLREVNRLEPSFSWFSRRIKKWLQQNRFLTLEI